MNFDNDFLSQKEQKQRILIVDDIPENLQILGNVLYDNGYDISFATSGKQALETIAFNQPAIILLDISMPEMNGYEVCQRLKNDPKTKEIPIIFLTANNDSQSIVRGFDVGGQDYVTKPFNHSELLVRIITHLELKNKNEALKNYTIRLEDLNSRLEGMNQTLQDQKETIELKNKDLTDGLNYAKYIQTSLFPNADKLKSYLPESFIFHRPKDIVSGDFYYYERIDNKIVIVIADCTGHGVPGALLTVLAISLLNQIIHTKHVIFPWSMLKFLDWAFINTMYRENNSANTHDGMDLGLCVFDTLKNELRFSNCRRPMFLFRNGNLQIFEPSIYSIGGYIDHTRKDFPKIVVPVQKDDVIYLFTDGYQSQFSHETDKKFGIARFRTLLTQIHTLPMNEQSKILDNQLKEWVQNDELIDDILVFGFRV